MVTRDIRFPVKRRALLFRAGEYTDKKLTVTPDDLLRLASSFRPVPLLVEHAPSPLELGELASVEAEGDHLFGMVALSEEAESLIRRSGAGALSVGLTPDLSAIREVSLVRHPRVDDARLFSDDGPRFDAELTLPPVARPLSAEDEALLSERLTPAAREPMRRLLSQGGPRFADSEDDPAELVRAALRALPAHAFRQASDLPRPVPAGDEEANAALLTPEEAAFYRRHFPGLPLSAVAARR